MKLRYPLVIALCTGLSAPLAAQDASAPPAVNENTVLMKVNGFEVTPAVFQAYRLLRQRPEPADPAQAQMQILNELANIVMVSQDAEARNLETRPGSDLLLEISRRIALTEMAVQDVVANHQVSEEELKKAYDAAYSDLPKEFKARHILVEEESAARDLIVELDNGGDFAELAKQHSTGPSGPQGGDLGWFSASTMVPPFAEAVSAMEKGTHSKDPVKTQFGWHVILLEDVREPAPPELENVQAKLEIQLKQQALGNYIAGLRDKTELELMGQAQPVESAQPEAAPKN